jgi:hypothetical protein
MTLNKSTSEIRSLLGKANIDFESAVNRALNDYLNKILPICPFTEDVCQKKQCLDCDSSKKILKKAAQPKYDIETIVRSI